MSHNPPLGAPCWFEFSSTDAKRSLPFFCALFDWRNNDQDMGDFGVYSFLQQADGATIGAHWQMPKAQMDMGTPSNWGVYYKVASVAHSHKQALSLGASEIVPPMDVHDYGRMSVLSDPTGAVFSLWQEVAENPQPFSMFVPGSIGWVELATRDAPGANSFYRALLGWQLSEESMPPEHGGSYTRFYASDTAYGGILPMTKEWDGIPPHWGIYVIVQDVDACIAKAASLGGKLCVPAFDVPDVGRIAVLNEPTGGAFSVIKPARG